MKRQAHPLRELQEIPGIGPSLARDLLDLGYSRISQLKGEDPEAMYLGLCRLRGAHIDRCVLYAFRCAVYYASHAAHDAELLKWWNWKDGGRAQPGPAPRRLRRGAGAVAGRKVG